MKLVASWDVAANSPNRQRSLHVDANCPNDRSQLSPCAASSNLAFVVSAAATTVSPQMKSASLTVMLKTEVGSLSAKVCWRMNLAMSFAADSQLAPLASALV